MRFARSIVVALTAVTTSVNALRQHKQRALLDVCANVDADLALLAVVFGKIDLCLCVSALPVFITTNLFAKAAVLVNGDAAVIAALTALINAAPDHKECTYPEHSVAICSSDDPCGFSCSDGFTPSPPSKPTDCVCEAPNTVCNGVCGDFPSCSSSKAKRDSLWRDATCPHGWSACGIWGGGRLDYECVDVKKDLWSCGGCSLPLLPTDPIGVDCTTIPGVHDVSCHGNRCVVQRCKDGFNVSGDQTSCVPTTRMLPNNPVFVNNGGVPYKE